LTELCEPITEHVQDANALLQPYLNPAPLVVVISGPSGVGKDSVVKRMAEMEFPLHFVVTVTTRPMRPGEIHGVDYYFVSDEGFQRMKLEDELLEDADVYGQCKGVPRMDVARALASGRDVVLRLDVNGAATIRSKIPQAISIFLVPPSMKVLADRLRRRPGDSEEQVLRRLQTAYEELEQARSFDYVVVNREGQLDDAVEQVVAIMAAERCRAVRQPIAL